MQGGKAKVNYSWPRNGAREKQEQKTEAIHGPPYNRVVRQRHLYDWRMDWMSARRSQPPWVALCAWYKCVCELRWFVSHSNGTQSVRATRNSYFWI